MKRIKSIQIKAALLLVVFSLNTIIGFACAVGMDMGFNRTHHQTESEASGQQSRHCAAHEGNNKVSFHKQHKTINAYSFSNPQNDNCCNRAATKFSLLDKNVDLSDSAPVPPVFPVAFFDFSLFNTTTFYTSGISDNTGYLVRSWRLPAPDIRIVIRSFQI